MEELVSIIMPSYNTDKFIPQSIESVLNQTYANWELLIVDDFSSDETVQAVHPFLTDKRIRFYRGSRNQGAAICRNKGLREAKGKWIAFLDSDDIWTPDKLEKQIAFMKSRGCHFSYTAYEEIDEASMPTGIHVGGPKHINRYLMRAYCWPGCLTVMYDNNAIGEGIQAADIKKNNDYAMWLKISRRADCFFLNETLAKYRKRSGSISDHNWLKLILWHYKLFRIAENQGILISGVSTLQNIFFGCIKKIFYVKKYETE